MSAATYRWIEGNTILEPATSFNNWSSGYPIDNSEGFDCVKFTADGWRVHQGFCASSALPFLCRQRGRNTEINIYCLCDIDDSSIIFCIKYYYCIYTLLPRILLIHSQLATHLMG